MDQTPPPQCTTTRGFAALLVDGENIPAQRAPILRKALGSLWPPSIRRVYGDAPKVRAWEDEAGFRLFHSGYGKNSADMLLAVDAMSLAFDGQVRHIIIASSDGDFSHVAHRLREMGLGVTGVGEARTPKRFQNACTRFVELPAVVIPSALLPSAVTLPLPPKAVQPKARSEAELAPIIRDMVRTFGANGLLLCKLQPEMNKRIPGFTLAQLHAKTWRAYLSSPASAKLFRISGDGIACRVTLATP